MSVFKDKKGANNVLNDSPWTINGCWLTLKEWDPEQALGGCKC